MQEKAQPLEGTSAWRGRCLVFVAAILWSTSGFFAKAPYFAGWPGIALASWRGLFAGLVLLPLVRSPRWSWKLLPMMVCFGVMCWSYLTSLEMMSGSSAGCALWLQATAQVWVLLVGVFVFGERTIWRDWLLVTCAFAGVMVMIFFRSQGAPLAAVLIGLFSGVLYAGIVLCLRQLRNDDSAWLAVLNQFGTALLLFPVAILRDQLRVPESATQWGMLGAFGIFQIGLPYVLFAAALRSIPGHEATVLALIEPLLLPVWIYLAWGDAPDTFTLVAGAFILTGLAIRYWPAKATPEQS